MIGPMNRRNILQAILALPIISWLVGPRPVKASQVSEDQFQWPLYQAQRTFTIGGSPPIRVEKGALLPYDGQHSVLVDGKLIKTPSIKGAVRFGLLIPVNEATSLQDFVQPHTCGRPSPIGETMDRLSDELFQKYLSSATGRSRLLRLMTVLSAHPLHCSRCEARIQHQMQAILDSLEGDEKGWVQDDGQHVEANMAARHVKHLLGQRISASPPSI
jgi:hypothetical protein